MREASLKGRHFCTQPVGIVTVSYFPLFDSLFFGWYLWILIFLFAAKECDFYICFNKVYIYTGFTQNFPNKNMLWFSLTVEHFLIGIVPESSHNTYQLAHIVRSNGWEFWENGWIVVIVNGVFITNKWSKMTRWTILLYLPFFMNIKLCNNF